MAKPKEAATEYLKEVLAKIPDEVKRKAVEEAILGTEEVLEDIGGHILRKSDHSRAMDEARAAKEKADQHKATLDTWFQTNQRTISDGLAALARVKELEEQVAKGSTHQDLDDPEAVTAATVSKALEKLQASGYVKKDEVERLVAQTRLATERDGMVIMNALNKLSLSHFKDHGEILDVDALVALAQEKQMPLVNAYQVFAAEKIEAKAKKDVEAKEKKLREEIEAKVRKEMSAGPPYPVGGDEPSTLAGLTPAKDAAVKSGSLKNAVEEYHRMLGR